MMPNLNLLPGAIIEMLATTAHTHSLTQADRYGLMAAILDESLSEEERRCIDRMLRSLLRGKIEIVNEVSALA
ncbi:hypothetical protein PCC9214_02348 [Planktothrix tepida]|uniref:Uncharacterized protein n=3 Tax=Microcoleaceae TaxID=1892252 RepID=A0A1J1LHA0_9CYAN|nr:hypothetical protein PCC9214_02348 [Planktothrix tepida]CAD5963182.1 hypothetical protein NO713_03334 [Planktothrix pseudagardhii]CUR31864.1 conserved hypothetical protein [Planktothrix tepida PCC 9214]